MPAHLVIQDGNPWWISPDIRVVPGNDPNGPPGSPIAGQGAYLWARVSNTGNADANGCRVDFYWANPSAQIAVGVATLIGSAFADLAAGAAEDVLCLVPWTPVIVNGGHECVLAVVHGAGDQNPIPDPLPNGYPFDPPAHDQVAQLNLSVLEASMIRMPLTVFVNATGRTPRRATMAVEIGERLDERVLEQFGLKGYEPVRSVAVEVTLGLEARCHDAGGQHRLEVEVARGASVPVFVHLDAQRLPHRRYQLVHVVERSGDKVTGGVSYLVVNTRGHHEQPEQEQAQ